MAAWRAGLVAGFVMLLAGTAQAQVLERVRAAGVLQCAAESLPGFAEIADDGGAEGRALDLCRAVAVAVLGPQGKVVFSTPQAGTEFDDLRAGRVDVAFFSEAALREAEIDRGVVPGPVVFEDSVGLLVGAESAAVGPADLAGATVCLMIGSGAQRVLEDYVTARGITIIRAGYREDVEMLDAFNSRNCDAVVDAGSRLAEMQGVPAINRRPSRVLATPLAVTPIHALVPEGDFAWAGLVFGLVARPR